jgi:hypothetical protein
VAKSVQFLFRLAPRLAACALIRGFESSSFVKVSIVASSDVWPDTKIICLGDWWNQPPLSLLYNPFSLGFQGHSPWLVIVTFCSADVRATIKLIKAEFQLPGVVSQNAFLGNHN